MMRFDLNLRRTSGVTLVERGKRATFLTLFTGLGLTLLMAYLLYVPEARTIRDQGLKVGDIAREDIVVQKNFTIEDKEMTAANRQKALASITPIYQYELAESGHRPSPHPGLVSICPRCAPALPQEPEYTGPHPRGDEQPLCPGNTRKRDGFHAGVQSLRSAGPNLLLPEIKKWQGKGLLASKLGIPKTRENIIAVVSPGGNTAIAPLDNFYDLKDVESELKAFLAAQGGWSARQISALGAILLKLIPSNIIYANALNKEQEERVLAEVHPVTINLKKGKILLRRGDEITAAHLKLIVLISSEEKGMEKGFSEFYLIVFLLSLLLLFLWRFFSSSRLGGLNRQHLNRVTAVTLLTAVLIYRVSLFLFPLILKSLSGSPEFQDLKAVLYALPFAFGALTMAFLFDLPSAVIFAFANALHRRHVCEWNFKIMLFVLASNLAAAFAIEHYQRLKRSSILKAGFFWLVPINALVILMLALTELSRPSRDWMLLSLAMTMGIISALLSAFIANFLMPLWEVLFRLITDLKLVEITNLNLPVFRDMLEKAPGTYHHSQMVATLGESAAQDLKSLVTAGAGHGSLPRHWQD